jgi:hypothetical protein
MGFNLSHVTWRQSIPQLTRIVHTKVISQCIDDDKDYFGFLW